MRERADDSAPGDGTTLAPKTDVPNCGGAGRASRISPADSQRDVRATAAGTVRPAGLCVVGVVVVRGLLEGGGEQRLRHAERAALGHRDDDLAQSVAVLQRCTQHTQISSPNMTGMAPFMYPRRHEAE